MNDDTRTVAHSLYDYAEHSNDEGVGTLKARLRFEQATAILRENDIRNHSGRYDPLTDYETVLLASATAIDYLAAALSETTGKARAEVYADLHTHITEHPAERP